MDEPRSRATRARAELALVRLLHELREERVFLVVLGGLVPEVLSRDDGLIPVHLGTTDVDVLLITHVDPDADLGGVERALERMEFNADNAEGWRRRGPVAGAAVKLEFLCDLPDHPEHEVICPRGCTTLAAVNLRGTGYVAQDFAWEELSGELTDGTPVTVRVRFAGLQGYLLSKSSPLAAVARPRTTTTSPTYSCITALAGRSKLRSSWSMASSRRSCPRCAQSSSRSENATRTQPTSAPLATPSRHSRWSPKRTLASYAPTPSMRCSGSSRPSIPNSGTGSGEP